jgi:hypothetical protein
LLRSMCLMIVLALTTSVGAAGTPDKAFGKWTLDEAVAVLNKSPWARQLTFTQVVGGIGSGVFGEKEIYSTFFVRFLSARPIREAIVRLKQLHDGYDAMDDEARREFDAKARKTLDLRMERWIVITVNFRSNNPDTERRVKQFFQSQSFETMKNRVYLSTIRFPHLQISAYYPPQGDTIGAKFIFPREFDSEPVVSSEDKAVTFELDVVGVSNNLVVDFPLSQMMVDGELIL